MALLRETRVYAPGDVVLDASGNQVRLTLHHAEVIYHSRETPLWVGVDLDGAHTTGDVVYTEAGWTDIALSKPADPTRPAEDLPALPDPNRPPWALVPVHSPGRGILSETEAAAEAAAAMKYAASAVAQSTSDKYWRCWLIFERWCQDRNISDGTRATAGDIAKFISQAADGGLKPSTIDGYLAAIRFAFQVAGRTAPSFAKSTPIGMVRAGIRREHGTPPEKKTPLKAIDVRKIVDAPALTRNDLLSKRDRAMILFGYASAMRRSELAALSHEDILWHPDGAIITIRRSKGDQDGHGQRIAVPSNKQSPYCPITALKTWIDAAGIIEGPIFRRFTGLKALTPLPLSGQRIAQIIKHHAAAVGFDPDQVSGHSLRRGWSTDVGATGNLAALMKQLRHTSTATSLEYIDDAQLDGHPGKGLL